MSDSGSSPKQIFLSALVVLLLLVVSIQGWYIYNMKEQQDDAPKQPSSDKIKAAEPVTVTIKGQEQHEDKLPAPDTNQARTDTQKSNNAGQWPVNNKSPVNTNDEKNASTGNDMTTAYGRSSSSFFDDSFYQTFNRPVWNPYKEIDRMRREMNRALDKNKNDIYNDTDFHQHFSMSNSTPEIDIHQDDDKYTVLVNLPGAEENDISVILDGRRLTIKGKQDYKKQDRDASGNLIFQVHRSGRFKRSITLSEPVNQSEMKTHLDNGILTIIIPKTPDKQ